MHTISHRKAVLKEILGNCNVNLDFWSAQVLFALEDTFALLQSPKNLCKQAEERLWAKELTLNDSGSTWNIKGFSEDGGLRVQKGSQIKVLKNW